MRLYQPVKINTQPYEYEIVSAPKILKIGKPVQTYALALQIMAESFARHCTDFDYDKEDICVALKDIKMGFLEDDYLTWAILEIECPTELMKPLF